MIVVNGDSFFAINLSKFVKNTKNDLIKIALVKNQTY